MCYQTWEGLWNFSKISSSQHYPYSLPFFQNYYQHPFYSPSFYHLPRLIIFFLLKKVVFSRIELKIILRKESLKWSEFALLKRRKRKEVKEDPRWPMEGFNAWWPMEGSNVWWPMEGSNVRWPMEGSNVQWPMEGKGEAPFHLFLLSPQEFLLKLSFFPLILMFYFMMVLGC